MKGFWLLYITFALALTGCGLFPDDKSDIVGKWWLSRVASGSEINYTMADSPSRYEFKSDGSMSFTVSGSTPATYQGNYTMDTASRTLVYTIQYSVAYSNSTTNKYEFTDRITLKLTSPDNPSEYQILNRE